MKKKYVILLMVLAIVMLFTGCAKVASEKQIKTDLEKYEADELFGDDEELKEVVIERRQTDKKRRTDKVWCTVTTQDSEMIYQKELTIMYGLYDKKGWAITSVTVNDPKYWQRQPIAGASDETIRNSLIGEAIQVNGESWTIAENELKELTISDHETDLEGKIDKVSASIMLEGAVERVQGQLKLTYKFDDAWTLYDFTISEEMQFEDINRVALNVTDDMLISKLVENDIETDNCTITVEKEEISDFAVIEETKGNKGTERNFKCSATVTKPCVTIAIDALFTFSYFGNTWTCQPVDILAEVQSVNLIGEWTGTYRDTPFSGTCTLNLTNVDDNGTITGTYSYVPEYIDSYSEPGSYNVSGKIDLRTMKLNLEAGEWIEEPEHPLSYEKQAISATLDFNEDVISGTAHCGDNFEVSLNQ